MEVEDKAVRQDEEPMLVAEAARYWWVAIIGGMAWLVIAWLVLRADITSLATVGLLLGVLFVGSAVNELALARIVSGGWKFLHYGMGFLFLLAGLWAFIRPIDTFFALASVLGLILVFYGAFEISRAVASREENPYWWIGLIGGVLLLLLAVVVSSSDRQFDLARRTFLILFWVGFMALVRGVTHIILGFTLRHLGKTVDRRQVGGGAAAAAGATVPAQERREPGRPESARDPTP